MRQDSTFFQWLFGHEWQAAVCRWIDFFNGRLLLAVAYLWGGEIMIPRALTLGRLALFRFDHGKCKCNFEPNCLFDFLGLLVVRSCTLVVSMPCSSFRSSYRLPRRDIKLFVVSDMGKRSHKIITSFNPNLLELIPHYI